jgi:hypothetical protein
MHGFTHPDQELMYYYKGNHKLGLQMKPTLSIGKNSMGKVRTKLSLFPYLLCSYLTFSFLFLPVLQETQQKAKIKDGHLYRNHCWHELGLGMISSHRSNPSSHIANIRASNNSDFAFQKVVSGAPMPKKKEILQQKSVATKVVKIVKTRLHNVVLMPKKETLSKAMKIHKATPPKELAYMKAPPKSSASCPVTHWAVR